MADLDSILSGNPGEDAPPPGQSPTEPVAPPRDEPPPPPRPPGGPQVDFGRRSADPEPPPPADRTAPPPDADQDDERIPVSALRDERRKRQDLERRIAEYERAMQQQPQAPPPQRPDLFEDPDGALEFVQRQFQSELTRTRLDMSVSMAKSQHDDYDAAEAAFVEAVKANPVLYDQMMADPHPAGFAYRVGRQVQALREIGPDPQTYRDKVRQELEAEIRQQMAAEQPVQRPQRQSLPPSLAGGRDTNGRFQPQWSGPPSLKDILTPRRK